LSADLSGWGDVPRAALDQEARLFDYKWYAALAYISANRLNELVRGKRGVTAETALRLARLLGASPEFWLNAQKAVDLFRASARIKVLPPVLKAG